MWKGAVVQSAACVGRGVARSRHVRKRRVSRRDSDYTCCWRCRAVQQTEEMRRASGTDTAGRCRPDWVRIGDRGRRRRLTGRR